MAVHLLRLLALYSLCLCASFGGVAGVRVPASCSRNGTCANQITQALLHVAAAANQSAVELEPFSRYELKHFWFEKQGAPLVMGDLSLLGQKEVVLDGHGSTLVMMNLNPLFWLVSAHHGLSLKNFTVASLRVPYTLGKVVASTANQTELEFDSELYPPPCRLPKNEEGYGWLSGVEAVLEWDPAGNRPAPDAVDVYNLPPAKPFPITWRDCATQVATAVTTGRLSLGWAPSQGTRLPVGASLVLRHAVYSAPLVTVIDSSKIRVEDVWLQSGGGMGLKTTSCSDIVVNRLKVAPAPRYAMSICADAVHLLSCRGGPVSITDSHFQGQGDDGLNIPSRYVDLESWSGNEIKVGMDGSVFPLPSQLQARVGDMLTFYQRKTFVPYFHTRVKGLTSASIALEDPVPAAAARFDLVWNANAHPESVTLSRTTFSGNRARGALLKTSPVHVSDCRFENSTGPAIQAQPDGAYWFEAGLISGGWKVENCTFTGNNYGPARMPGDIFLSVAVPTKYNGNIPQRSGEVLKSGLQHKGISLQGNNFDLLHGQAALLSYGIDGLDVGSNRVTRSVTPQPPVFAGSPYPDFYAHNSQNVTQRGNVCPATAGKKCSWLVTSP